MSITAHGSALPDPGVIAGLEEERDMRLRLDDLTEREAEVLALIALGRSNWAICKSLSLAKKTVETHIASIFSKLELPPDAGDHRRVLAALAHVHR